MDKAKNILLELMKYNTFLYPENVKMYDDCATYISSLFAELDFNTKLIQTNSGKIVICKRLIDVKLPHVHFNGHYDIVPITDNNITNFDDNTHIFFGRGCSDMKGGIVSIWLACKDVIERKIPCNISISFSPDEETGGKIASKQIPSIISEFLPLESLVIIADSSHPSIITSHCGACWIDVKISLESTQRFIANKLSAFEIMCKYCPEFIKTPSNIDAVIGGICKSSNAVNLWAHTVSFTLDYRFDAPSSVSDIKDWINNHFASLNSFIKDELDLNTNPLTWTNILEVEPSICTADFNNYLDVAKSIIPNAHIDKANGFYDLRYFRDAGYSNSFVLGPGDVLNAHVKYETLKKRNVEECSQVYIKFIEGVANGDF